MSEKTTLKTGNSSENLNDYNEENIEKSTDKIDDISEFQTLNENDLNKEIKKVDLNKTTTKGLRITERTKIRYNQAEKASGLSQEEFTNRLLDMCDFFGPNDLSNNPEFIELTNIVNRIPEIFVSLISKQKTSESTLTSKYIKQIDDFKIENENLTQEYEQLKVNYQEELNKLESVLEKVKTETDLKIREQDLTIEKQQKELNEKEEKLNITMKSLDVTKENLETIKTEQFKNMEKINEKSDEINNLNKELQDTKNELLTLKQEKIEIESTIADYKKNADYYKMKLENTESAFAQQKEMYEEQIKHYKSLISSK